METTTLGDLISLQRGYDLTETQRRPGAVPIVGSAGIHGYHDTARAKGPGVALGRSGASFGRVSFVKEDYWPHNTTIFVTDFKGNDPLFIRYLLESLYFSSLNSGSAQQSLNRNYVYLVPVKRYSFPIQRRIAGILSAYDELIENSQRCIKILESMARALYREWFVHFRFPGHEAVPRVPSPLGEIPKGWEVDRLERICDRITSGGTPRTSVSDYWDGGIAWLSSGETGNSFIIETEKSLTEKGVANSSTRLARAGCTVIAGAGQGKTRGQTSMLRLDCYINQWIIALTADGKQCTDNFLFFNLSGRYNQLRKISDGSSRGSLTTKLLAELDIIIPPYDLVSKFDDLVGPIVKSIEIGVRRIQNLHRTRDLLLPRLLSGQLELETEVV